MREAATLRVRPDGLRLAVVTLADLTTRQKEEIVALCSRAFAEEDFGTLFELVSGSTHILAWLERRLVGHALFGERRLQPEGLPELRTAYVDAVATDPELQGRGIGSAVMERLAASIRDFEFGGLSTERPSFYARLGWERWPGPLAVRGPDGIVETPDDIVMILRTP